MQLIPVVRYALCITALGILAACSGGGSDDSGQTPANDTVAPQIVSSVPARNANNIDPTTAITVNFNEPIVIGSASIVLQVNNTQVATTISSSGSTLTVQLNDADVEGNATLSLAGIADGAGNVVATSHLSWSYRSLSADTTPPVVAQRSPHDQAIGVPASTPIWVQFNEPIATNNVVVDLRLGAGTETDPMVPTSIALSGNDTLQITPNFSSPPTGLVTLAISGVRDLAGNTATDVVWSWTYSSSTAGGPLLSDKVEGAGIGGNGYLDYGCTNDAMRPSSWSGLFVRTGATGTGTRANPYGTIGQAIAATGATRTVICVATGNYAENINLGMQRRQMLVGGLNSAFTARDPIASPTTVTAADANQHVMRAEAPVELVIDGFVVTGSHNRGIEVSAWDANERITLLNNHVHHNGCTTPTARTDCGGIDVGGGRTVAVDIGNNVIEENGGGHHGGGVNIGGTTENLGTLDQTATTNDGFGDVVTMTGLVAKVHHNIIRHNRLYEASLPHGAGMAIGMHGDVHHNEFSGNDTVSDGDHYGVGAGLIGQHDRGGSASIALLVVRNNWFEANRAAKAGSAIFLDQFNVGYVYNNVVARNFGTGAILVDGNCGDTCPGPNGNHGRNFATILNNTVVDNEGAGLAVQDSTAHLYFNIFWRNHDNDVSGDIASFNGSPGADNRIHGAHNIININTADFPLLADSASGEGVPLLRSLQSQDYRLTDPGNPLHPYRFDQQFVPAIVLPTSLQPPEDDFDGASRPDNAGRYLYGAYGHAATSVIRSMSNSPVRHQRRESRALRKLPLAE
jgi:hypothetical protein